MVKSKIDSQTLCRTAITDQKQFGDAAYPSRQLYSAAIAEAASCGHATTNLITATEVLIATPSLHAEASLQVSSAVPWRSNFDAALS